MKCPKPHTFRSKKYLEFVRRHPCCMCTAFDKSMVAHHEGLGRNMMGGKPPDSQAVPLCGICHQVRHDMGVGFWQGVDMKMIIIRLLEEWIEKNEFRTNSTKHTKTKT